MQTYNLFRSRESNPLVCAVPEERSVPSFVTAERWEFGGRLEDKQDPPLGFDMKAAAAAVRFNGFYIFAEYRRSRAGAHAQ